MIRLKDVTKYYYSDTSVTQGLQKINLEFKLGEFVAITGESGSGKSTLLNVISGMDTYEEGELYFGEQETSGFSEEEWEDYRRNHISLIYQSYNLIDSYSALENIESVLLICEETLGKMTKQQRKERAMEVLASVGLEKHAHHKASHLSSGQKQRLGIARALAKNTDIIIADEPTGNLDIENGKAVMEILHKLSKDKLVIVVTHNYEQAAPYVTRKVRLYDGEVAENIEIAHVDERNEAEAVAKLKVQETEKPKFSDTFKTALRFVHLNIKGQPHRTFFLFTFIFLTSLAMLIFIGSLCGAGDDTQTKNNDTTTFSNVADNRLIVKRMDGALLTEEDYKKISKIQYVTSTEKYDGANDINYYWKVNEDYRVTYKTVANGNVEFREVDFYGKENYLRSCNCLSKSDLKEGKLPENYNEVVVSSKYADKLGKEIDFYFKNSNDWGSADYVGITMKVVGVIKENTEQVYFSESMARSLNVEYEDMYRLEYTLHREILNKTTQELKVTDAPKSIMSVLYIINDTLEENQVRLSNLIYSDLQDLDTERTRNIETILEDMIISVRYVGGKPELRLNAKLKAGGTLHSDSVVEVSEEFFSQIFPDLSGQQYAVYIRDYAYTDKVIDALYKQGYEGLSVVRFSATTYNDAKLQEKMVMLGISAGATVVIFFLGIFVVTGMLRMKKGDFFILRSLGLKTSVLKKINYINVTVLTAISLFIVNVGAIVLAIGLDAANDIIKYMEPIHYICVILLNLSMVLISAWRFNKFLLKTFKITALRES